VAAERWVILGLAPSRAGWFSALAHWTSSAAVAAEFVKCVSVEEVRARLASGRAWSVLVVDAATPGLDRDLVDESVDTGVPVILVGTPNRGTARGHDLAVAAVLSADFGPDDLMEALAIHCRPVGTGSAMPPVLDDEGDTEPWQGMLVCVCGPGGTGASVSAMAIASGLGRDPRYSGQVLLADIGRRADQALLHDCAELGPGLQELVEAHRVGRPGPDEIDRMTFEVPQRAYRLLLGLRQPEGWAAIRPRAFDASLAGLRRNFAAVVADVTGDFEGESQGGSLDVQERNHPARSTALQATVTVAVGAPGVKGVHSLAVVVRQLVAAGVAPERIVTVVNRSPRAPRGRAETARALADLLGRSGITTALAAPVAVGERKLEAAHRDLSPLPSALVEPLTRAVQSVAERVADFAPAASGPVRVAPGSLGSWAGPGAGSA
jgi:hypothetical protein